MNVFGSTEGNSWGTRLIDYMAVECLPLIVNDGIVPIFTGLVPYENFSLHMSKADVPSILTRLRAINPERQAIMRLKMRAWKRAFIWFRPEGLAYEYTIAALGERLHSYVHSPETRSGA